ncbi:MAG TPA: HAD family acid phosphatase [Rhizomicrobium sp.]|nr:HAD family acid phosphatase [Rhizomicrobium sp.]
MTIPPAAEGDADPWQCKTPVTKTPPSIHWLRNSLEYCRIAVNIYDEALAAATRIARTHKPHQWIVMMDADETVLDNSLFERERRICGGEFQDAQWRSWVRANLAADVPGAAGFTEGVHRLGGLVAIVTNRSVEDDPLTRATLKKAGIRFDYEIGMTGDHSDKTDRWRGAVVALTSRRYGQPTPAMWLGDQMTDLGIVKHGRIVGAMSQQYRDDIGPDDFLLPNPMYSGTGGWTDNPDR